MRTIYIRIIGIVIVVSIFYFIGNIGYREWDKISAYNWSPHFVWFMTSILFLVGVYFIGAYGWTLILRMLGVRIEGTKGVTIFLLSLFGRYIPGGVWSVLGRMYLCRLEGIPDSRSSISIVLEQAYPIASAGVVFAGSLFFWGDIGPVVKVLPPLFLLPLFFIFLHPKPFLKIANPILSWMGRGPIDMPISFNNILVLAGYYLFYWAITGMAFYSFINAFYPISVSYIPILSGIYAISFAAGYLAFLTPAGLGVREGSLTLLLSLFIPTPVAIATALLSRLWLIGVEIIILVLFMINAETRKMARTALGW